MGRKILQIYTDSEIRIQYFQNHEPVMENEWNLKLKPECKYIITKYCTVTIKELSVIYTAQSPTWRSITLRRLRLRAVLDNFGF